MKAVKLEEVEAKGENLDEVVAIIKKATAGTSVVMFEICAKYKEEEK
jgi:hypothetical protein